MRALRDARTVVMSPGRCRRSGWECDDHRCVWPCLRIRFLRGEVLAERVGRWEQEGKKPSLPAGGPNRRREGAAVLDAENRAAERNRDVAVLAAAHTWEQRQPRQSEADPQHCCERRRRGQARRLKSRQEPRSHRGPCRCLPQILHVRQPQVLVSKHRRSSALRRPPCEGVGPRRAAKAPAQQSGPSSSP
jgi:hypothetical protein